MKRKISKHILYGSKPVQSNEILQKPFPKFYSTYLSRKSFIRLYHCIPNIQLSSWSANLKQALHVNSQRLYSKIDYSAMFDEKSGHKREGRNSNDSKHSNNVRNTMDSRDFRDSRDSRRARYGGHPRTQGESRTRDGSRAYKSERQRKEYGAPVNDRRYKRERNDFNSRNNYSNRIDSRNGDRNDNRFSNRSNNDNRNERHHDRPKRIGNDNSYPQDTDRKYNSRMKGLKGKKTFDVKGSIKHHRERFSFEKDKKDRESDLYFNTDTQPVENNDLPLNEEHDDVELPIENAEVSSENRLSRLDLSKMDEKTQKMIQNEFNSSNNSVNSRRPIVLPMKYEYNIPYVTHMDLAQDEEYMSGASGMIGLDVGTEYIGIAYTPYQTKAVPLTTIKYVERSIPELAVALKGELMVQTYPIAAVVVGVQESHGLDSAKLYKIIKECWERERIIVPILFEDEFRTTKDAINYLKTNDYLDMREILEDGKNAAKEKGKIDMIAAQFILQKAINKIHHLNMEIKRAGIHVADRLGDIHREEKLSKYATERRDYYNSKVIDTYARFNVILSQIKGKKKSKKAKKSNEEV